MQTGKIVAVCTSFRTGIPKYPLYEVRVAQYGFVSDYHCKPMRQSFSNPGTEKPNTDRHITILAQEATDAVCAELMMDKLPPGALGENILTQGLGDLSYVDSGARILIGSGVYLVVTEQNKPCPNLAHFHPFFNTTIWKPNLQRRRLLCAVELGVGQVVKPGDPIVIL